MICLPAVAIALVFHFHAVTLTEDTSFPPTSLTASVGQRVVIRCRTTVEGHVQWMYFNDSLTKHEQIVASEGTVLPQMAEHYSLNSSGTRDHELIVKRSRLEDTGLYSCIEDSGIGVKHMSCLFITGEVQTENSCDGDCSGHVVISVVVTTAIALVVMVAALMLARNRWRKTEKKNVSQALLDPEDSNGNLTKNTRKDSRHSITGETNHTSGNNGETELTAYQPLLKPPNTSATDDGPNGNTTAISHLVTKFCRTIVADADCKETCSRVFTIVGDNLYLVNATQKKIQVHSIAENSVDVRREDNDIDLSKLELKKPCCFTANLDGKRLYLGDRESRVIFEILLEDKTTKALIRVERGKVQCLSAIKDGLVALITEKDIEDVFWAGQAFIYNSDGTFRTRLALHEDYFLPYCIEGIDDDLFAISYGMFDKSGLAIFSEQEKDISLVTGNKNLCVPGNFCYDKDDRLFVIADAGTKQVLAVELNADRKMGDPHVLRRWGNPEKLDFNVDSLRPVRVMYVGRTEPKRVVITLRNGRIDLYCLMTT